MYTHNNILWRNEKSLTPQAYWCKIVSSKQPKLTTGNNNFITEKLLTAQYVVFK